MRSDIFCYISFRYCVSSLNKIVYFFFFVYHESNNNWTVLCWHQKKRTAEECWLFRNLWSEEIRGAEIYRKLYEHSAMCISGLISLKLVAKN